MFTSNDMFVPALSPNRSLFIIVKAFASGIIFATAFIHVLPDSFDMSRSSCLADNPRHKFPFTGFVVMLSAIFTLMVDSMVTSIYTKKNNAIAADHGSEVVAGDHEKAITIAMVANGGGRGGWCSLTLAEIAGLCGYDMVQGIMFPMIESQKMAKKVVSYCRYPRMESRELESKEGVKKIEEIAAVDASEGDDEDSGEGCVEDEWEGKDKDGGGGANLGGIATPFDTSEDMRPRGYHMISGALDIVIFTDVCVEDVKRYDIITGIASKSPLPVIGIKNVLSKSKDMPVQQGLDCVATWNSFMLLSDDLKEVTEAKEKTFIFQAAHPNDEGELRSRKQWFL
ncbi:probable zinc transporter 10 [Tanacetum coccineum]